MRFSNLQACKLASLYAHAYAYAHAPAYAYAYAYAYAPLAPINAGGWDLGGRPLLTGGVLIGGAGYPKLPLSVSTVIP